MTVFGAASLPLTLVYLFMWTSPATPSNGEAISENFHLISNIAAAVSILLSNLIATGIGISVRQRREHESEIRTWAARTARSGSVTERNRIAREMHDVVAHSLTVMISLSDGAAVVVKKDPSARERCSANCPAPAGLRWLTCAASSACCGTTRPARAFGAVGFRSRPEQAARWIPDGGAAVALFTHGSGSS